LLRNRVFHEYSGPLVNLEKKNLIQCYGQQKDVDELSGSLKVRIERDEINVKEEHEE